MKLKQCTNTMALPNNGNYCMQCDANDDDDYNDAYKYVNDVNQLRDTVIGYGKMKWRLFCCCFSSRLPLSFINWTKRIIVHVLVYLIRRNIIYVTRIISIGNWVLHIVQGQLEHTITDRHWNWNFIITDIIDWLHENNFNYLFSLSAFIENVAQNGHNEVHFDENIYLNGSESCKMAPLAGILHTMMATAPKITTFDQHTNPFVFKCELSFFRKIRVSAYTTHSNFKQCQWINLAFFISKNNKWKCLCV